MGIYINPVGESAEEFLKRFGKKVDKIVWQDLRMGQVPVVLTVNYSAGIAYSEEELQRQTQPNDGRTKIFYIVPAINILSVVNPDEGVWLKNKLIESGLYQESINHQKISLQNWPGDRWDFVALFLAKLPVEFETKDGNKIKITINSLEHEDSSGYSFFIGGHDRDNRPVKGWYGIKHEYGWLHYL